ncbi:MAG: peptidoglycan-binding protein [Myxococcales bacterium]|nr:peptidoglycan-binding protein [Myxococcales bacterium]
MQVRARPAISRSSLRTPSAPSTVRATAARPTDTFSPAPAAGNRLPQVDLRRGDSGASVKALQDALVSLEYMTREQVATGPGIFGPRTEAAVRAAQAKHGLPQTGLYDAATRAALARELAPPVRPPPGSAQLPGAGLAPGSRGDEVKALQDAAVKLGYMTQAQVDTGYGNFGPRTENAVRMLQVRNGLPSTGKFDEATRAAMAKELQQHERPELMVKETYQRLLNREPTPAELASAVSRAVASREGGGSLRDMRSELVAQVRNTDEFRQLHPLGSGTVGTTEEADAYFLTQWGPTPYNSGGAPYGYNDCGPTSAAMALASLGLIERPEAADASKMIDALRDAALGYDSTNSKRMGFGSLERALGQHGAQTQMLPPPAIDSIDGAIERGNPVILGGNPWSAWGRDLSRAGNYLNGRDPGGHFVTVLGKTADGRYVVGDPLVKNGTIEVTADQLKTFLGQGFGAMEVSRP